MIEKFSFDVQSPRVKRKRIIMVKRVEESRRHVALKLMGYALYYEELLKVDMDVGLGFKADLVSVDYDSTVTLWVDCGNAKIKKIEGLKTKLRQARIVLMKEDRYELERFKAQVDKKTEDNERVEYLAFDPHFIDQLGQNFQRNNEFTIYEIDTGLIGVIINQQILETHLYT